MNKKILIIVAILVVVLISMVSCSAISTLLNKSNTVNYQISIDDLEAANVGTVVASNSIKSCVRIISTYSFGGETRTISGAGFVVSTDGYIITNRHVVVLYVQSLLSSSYSLDKNSTYKTAVEPTEIKVIFADDTYYNADVSYFIDEEGEIDLAILKLKNTGATVFDNLQIDQTTELYYGQSVFTFGNPEGIGLLFTSANIASPSMKMSSTSKYESIMLDGNINHGNSGGVLLNGNSKVIGVVFARVESKAGSNTNAYGLGCAIKSSDLIKFIKGSTVAASLNYSEYKPATE
ncbi:MAG: serine protease [Clostridia bacterium]|nr:serine protease [Clostridia bacterium]